MESFMASAESISTSNKSLLEENGRLRIKNKKLITENSELEILISKWEAKVEETKENLSTKEREVQELSGTVSHLKEEVNKLTLLYSEKQAQLTNSEMLAAELKAELEQVAKEKCQQKELLEEKIAKLTTGENKIKAEISECKQAIDDVREVNLDQRKQLDLANKSIQKFKTHVEILESELAKRKLEKQTMTNENSELAAKLESGKGIVNNLLTLLKEKDVESSKYDVDLKAKQETIQTLEKELSELKLSSEQKCAEYEQQVRGLTDNIFNQRQSQLTLVKAFLDENHKQQLERYNKLLESLSLSSDFKSDDETRRGQTENGKDSGMEEVAPLFSLSSEASSSDGSEADATFKSNDTSITCVSPTTELSLSVSPPEEGKAETVQVNGDMRKSDNHGGNKPVAELWCGVCNKQLKSKKAIKNHANCGKTAKKDGTVNPELGHSSSSSSSPTPLENKGKKSTIQNMREPNSHPTNSRKKGNAKNEQSGPVPCEECDLRFGDSEQLSDHVLKVHYLQVVKRAHLELKHY